MDLPTLEAKYLVQSDIISIAKSKINGIQN